MPLIENASVIGARLVHAAARNGASPLYRYVLKKDGVEITLVHPDAALPSRPVITRLVPWISIQTAVLDPIELAEDAMLAELETEA